MNSLGVRRSREKMLEDARIHVRVNWTILRYNNKLYENVTNRMDDRNDNKAHKAEQFLVFLSISYPYGYRQHGMPTNIG